MKNLNKEELTDIIYGCTILGTGGGGELQEGLGLIEKALDRGKEFKLISLDEIDPEGYIACPYRCGSISPEEEGKNEYSDLSRIDEEPSAIAYKKLEEFIGEKFQGVISTELGGGNTAAAFYTAAMQDKFIVDADPVGRSVPELQHSTFFMYDLPIQPMAIANEFGETAIITEVLDDFRAEALVRALAMASNNSVGVADHLARAKVLKGKVIEGAITHALNLGRTFRRAKEKGKNLSREIAEHHNGFMLFQGEIDKFEWKDENGFTVGNIYIKGQEEFSGDEYKIWFKNEHIITWKNGEIHVTVPDLVCIFDEDEKMPITNPNFRQGMRVSVLGLKSPEAWRTEKGLELFGPGHFGYSRAYIPLEKIEAK